MMNAPLTQHAKQRLAAVEALLESAAGEAEWRGPRGHRGHRDHSRLRASATAAVTRAPTLLECEPASVARALLLAARLGLVPDGTDARLLPRWDAANARHVAALEPTYEGIVKLARETAGIASVYAHLVRAGDDFRYRLGLFPELHHEPASGASVADGVRAEVTHAYAVAILTDGHRDFAILSREELDAELERGIAPPTRGWRPRTRARARLLALARLLRGLRVSPELRAALRLCEGAAHGEDPLEELAAELGLRALEASAPPPALNASTTTHTAADHLALVLRAQRDRLTQSDRPLHRGAPVEERPQQPTPPPPSPAVTSAERPGVSPTAARSSAGARSGERAACAPDRPDETREATDLAAVSATAVAAASAPTPDEPATPPAEPAPADPFGKLRPPVSERTGI